MFFFACIYRTDFINNLEGRTLAVEAQNKYLVMFVTYHGRKHRMWRVFCTLFNFYLFFSQYKLVALFRGCPKMNNRTDPTGIAQLSKLSANYYYQ